MVAGNCRIEGGHGNHTGHHRLVGICESKGGARCREASTRNKKVSRRFTFSLTPRIQMRHQLDGAGSTDNPQQPSLASDTYTLCRETPLCERTAIDT